MITQQASVILSMWMSQHDRALGLSSREVFSFPIVLFNDAVNHTYYVMSVRVVWIWGIGRMVLTGEK
jgi:hypothetical protein